MPNTMPNIETGGAAHIAGDVATDTGFIGRDQAPNHGNQVHIAMERLSEVSEREAANISELSLQISALTRALTGDPLRVDGAGLIQQVREMEATNKRREWWRVLSTWMLFFLIVSQLVQGWLIYQVYLLYWAIYQAVQVVR